MSVSVSMHGCVNELDQFIIWRMVTEMGCHATASFEFEFHFSSQGNNEHERNQRLESAQNEFRNEFRRRFHISVDDNEVSRGDNTTILQQVS